MPIYQGNGPFKIVVDSRPFQFYIGERGDWVSLIESQDGGINARLDEKVINVWGNDFPETTQQRPQALPYPEKFAFRSPHDLARLIIEHVLTVMKSHELSTDSTDDADE